MWCGKDFTRHGDVTMTVKKMCSSKKVKFMTGLAFETSFFLIDFQNRYIGIVNFMCNVSVTVENFENCLTCFWHCDYCWAHMKRSVGDRMLKWKELPYTAIITYLLTFILIKNNYIRFSCFFFYWIIYFPLLGSGFDKAVSKIYKF